MKKSNLLRFIGISLIAVVAFGGAYFALTTFLVEQTALTATVIPTSVLALTNEDRAANGVPLLTESALLDKAAQMKANDMAAKGYFAHVDAQGHSPLYWLDQVGYKYQNVGENLGRNYADAQALETGWMNSPEHRANVLRPQFTEAGEGVSSGMYQGELTTFAVEIFATPVLSQAEATAKANDAYTASLKALIANLQKKVAQLRSLLY